MTSTLIPAMKELQYIAVSPENPLKVVDVGVARGSFMVELDKLVHRMNVFAVGIDPVPRDGAEDRYEKFYFACADNVESWPKSPTKGLLYSDPEDDQASSLFPRGEVLKKDGKEVDVLNLNDIIEEDIPSGPIHFLKIDAEGKDLDIVKSLSPSTIKRIKYIALECKNGPPRFVGEANKVECIKYMSSIGFAVYYEYESENGTLLSDVVFVKGEEL